ncbi:MAG: hypothetical protein K8I82_04505, partial [Anaerolineae bacterium]|nr:hypothetical protein [Anaerolineae bacterium]
MVIEKKHIILIGLAMLIWVVTFLENISTIDAQMIVSRYAYLVLHSDGSAAVRIVDPQNPMQPIELMELPVNAGEYAGQGFLSPTGDWLLFQVFNEDIIKWRLFNIKSSSTFDVFEDISLAEPPMTFDGEYQSFSWSPDGKYFAINYLGTNG